MTGAIYAHLDHFANDEDDLPGVFSEHRRVDEGRWLWAQHVSWCSLTLHSTA